MKKTIDPKATLREKGLKATEPRLAVLAALARADHYASAQDIHKRLAKTGIDLVTVYRTLASFEEAGLARRVDIRKDAVYYELAGDHHHHLICTNCEKVSEIEIPEDDKLIAQALKQSKDFKSVSHHSFDLFGICRSCAKN